MKLSLIDRTFPSLRVGAVLAGVSVASACVAPAEESRAGGAAFSSNEVVLLDFELDGEVVVDDTDAADPRRAIASQMFYFVGMLYAHGSNARIDWVDPTSTALSPAGDGLTKIAYHAKIPIAWNKDHEVPKTFDVILPRRIDNAGSRAFYTKYKSACTKGHDYGADDFWHDFDPRLPTCRPDASDVVRAEAKVTPSPENTKGTYPEYDRIWEDGVLKVVVFFGANVSPSASDVGTKDYNTFVTRFARSLTEVIATPDALVATGPDVKEIAIKGKTARGRDVEATIILLSRELAASTSDFDAKIADLTRDADFVSYAGHSGLSRNVRALEQKLTVTPGKYRVLFLDGCNTAAYLDRTLHARVAEANGPGDPNGTVHLDLIGNVLPSYFTHSPGALMAVLNGLMAPEAPKTFDTLFEGIPAVQKVAVIGDEDNAFRP